MDKVSEANEETKGAFIPINANNDNGSTVTHGFAQTIDLNKSPMPSDDPDLKEVKLVMGLHSSAVTLKLTMTQGGQYSGRIKLWKDRKKTEEIQLPKDYTGENLPETLYVEGTEESGQVKDITLTLTAKLGTQEIGTDKVNISVTPVIKSVTMTTGRVASVPSGLQALTGETTPFGSPMLEPPGMKYETEMEVGRLSGSPRLIQNVTALNGTASYTNGSSKSVVLSTGSLPLIDCDVNPVQLEDMFYTIDSVTPLGDTSFKFKATDSPLFPYAPGALSSVSQVSGTFSFIMYNVWEFEDHTLRVLWKSPWSVYWHYHVEEAPVGTFSLKVDGDATISTGSAEKSHDKPAKLTGPAANNASPHWQ